MESKQKKRKLAEIVPSADEEQRDADTDNQRQVSLSFLETPSKRRKTLSVSDASGNSSFCGLERTLPRPQVSCTDCADTLVLCWGDKRRPYLRHMNKDTSRKCSGSAGETLLHKMAKKALVDFLSSSVQNSIKSTHQCRQCYRPQEHVLTHSIADVEWLQEQKLDNGGFADVAAVHRKTGKVVCVLEVVVTHSTLASARAGYEWYEFEASDVLDSWDRRSPTLEATLVETKGTTSAVDSSISNQQQSQRHQWTLYDHKPRPPMTLTLADGCGHRLCLSTFTIASELGFVQSAYSCEARMFADIAVRGQMTDSPMWNTQGGGPARMCGGNDKRASVLLAEIVRRCVCLRCGFGTDGISAQQPFCNKCFRTTRTECTALFAWRSGRSGIPPPRHDSPIHPDVRKSVLKQLEWLDEVPGTKDWAYGTDCYQCRRGYIDNVARMSAYWEPASQMVTSENGSGAYVSGYVWWFGIKKQICAACFQAEWETRRQRLLASGGSSRRQEPPPLAGIKTKRLAAAVTGGSGSGSASASTSASKTEENKSSETNVGGSASAETTKTSPSGASQNSPPSEQVAVAARQRRTSGTAAAAGAIAIASASASASTSADASTSGGASTSVRGIGFVNSNQT
jgi:hypothetical protein